MMEALSKIRNAGGTGCRADRESDAVLALHPRVALGARQGVVSRLSLLELKYRRAFLAEAVCTEQWALFSVLAISLERKSKSKRVRCDALKLVALRLSLKALKRSNTFLASLYSLRQISIGLIQDDDAVSDICEFLGDFRPIAQRMADRRQKIARFLRCSQDVIDECSSFHEGVSDTIGGQHTTGAGGEP